MAIKYEDIPWQEAACRGHPTQWWYDTENKTTRQWAENMCDNCPIQPQCLKWAKQNHEYGLWGGQWHKYKLRSKRQTPTPTLHQHIKTHEPKT